MMERTVGWVKRRSRSRVGGALPSGWIGIQEPKEMRAAVVEDGNRLYISADWGDETFDITGVK